MTDLEQALARTKWRIISIEPFGAGYRVYVEDILYQSPNTVERHVMKVGLHCGGYGRDCIREQDYILVACVDA